MSLQGLGGGVTGHWGWGHVYSLSNFAGLGESPRKQNSCPGIRRVYIACQNRRHAPSAGTSLGKRPLPITYESRLIFPHRQINPSFQLGEQFLH